MQEEREAEKARKAEERRIKDEERKREKDRIAEEKRLEKERKDKSILSMALKRSIFQRKRREKEGRVED